jgi:hypothetical protein
MLDSPPLATALSLIANPAIQAMNGERGLA